MSLKSAFLAKPIYVLLIIQPQLHNGNKVTYFTGPKNWPKNQPSFDEPSKFCLDFDNFSVSFTLWFELVSYEYHKPYITYKENFENIITLVNFSRIEDKYKIPLLVACILYKTSYSPHSLMQLKTRNLNFRFRILLTTNI